jgi:hypothetical protein
MYVRLWFMNTLLKDIPVFLLSKSPVFGLSELLYSNVNAFQFRLRKIVHK